MGASTLTLFTGEERRVDCLQLNGMDRLLYDCLGHKMRHHLLETYFTVESQSLCVCAFVLEIVGIFVIHANLVRIQRY